MIMEQKRIYLLTAHFAKSDITSAYVYADKENAFKHYAKIKKEIMENYDADDADNEEEYYFCRYDHSETNASFVKISIISETIDGKKISLTD